jgi:serine-type D-Ala-D-Ala carboxypeptidase (penicillin-binding protein 5/6)
MLRSLLLLLCCASPLWSKPLKVDIKAPAALLINADTGAILYGKEIHARYYPASITKIATALYILEKYGHRLDEMAAATAHAIAIVPALQRQAEGSKHPPYRLESGASVIGLRPGEEHSVSTLLYGLLLASGNDAANVLAESISGSIEQFMQGVNDFLASHGIKETHFVNPHGLHHPNHWTTAADMAAMTRLALKHPAFREIVKTTRYLRPKSTKPTPDYWVQTNRLLKMGPYFYPKAIGVKTGYTSHAGFTLVSAATHEGRTLIAVLLNCDDNNQRFREAIKLFDAAFAEKLVSRVLFAKGGDQFTHVISGAASKVEAALKDDLVIEYYPAEEPAFRAEIHWLNNRLPIRQDDKVGTLQLIGPSGEVLQQQPLYATHSIDKKWWAYLRDYKALFVGLFLAAQVALLLFYFLKKNQKIGQR